MPLVVTKRSRADCVQVIWFWCQTLAFCLAVPYAIHEILALAGIDALCGLFVLGGICAPFVLLRYLFRGLLVPLFLGMPCPSCREGALAYVRCRSFGYRYYRCSECRKRFKRSDIDQPWEDASSSLDAPYFEDGPIPADSRRRDWRGVGTSLILFGGMVVIAAAGSLLGGTKGIVVGTAVGVLVIAACPAWMFDGSGASKKMVRKEERDFFV